MHHHPGVGVTCTHVCVCVLRDVSSLVGLRNDSVVCNREERERARDMGLCVYTKNRVGDVH